MIVVMYLCLKQLPEMKSITKKGVTKPRKQPRYDLCFAHGNWNVLNRLKNNKGELFFNLIPSDKNAHRKRNNTTPEYYLQCTPSKSKAVNFSGIRFFYSNNCRTVFASGEPSLLPKLAGNVANPMYERRNDGFLFIFSDNMETLEILVVDNGRAFIDTYRRQFAMGHFDEVLTKLREQEKPISQ